MKMDPRIGRMSRRTLLVATAALALGGGAAHANPASTVAILLNSGIIASTSLNNHVAAVNIGPNFSSGDFNSQQQFCGTVLLWFQQQDATVTSFTLYDTTGVNVVGTYTTAGLALGSS